MIDEHTVLLQLEAWKLQDNGCRYSCCDTSHWGGTAGPYYVQHECPKKSFGNKVAWRSYKTMQTGCGACRAKVPDEIQGLWVLLTGDMDV